MRYVVLIGLTFIRIILVGYFVTVVVVDYVILMVDTCSFNNINWWQSKDEPFITNANIINAVVAWTLWYINLVVYALCFFVLVLLVFAGGVFLMTGGCSFESALRSVANGLKFVLKFACKIVTGTYLEEVGRKKVEFAMKRNKILR